MARRPLLVKAILLQLTTLLLHPLLLLYTQLGLNLKTLLAKQFQKPSLSLESTTHWHLLCLQKTNLNSSDDM